MHTVQSFHLLNLIYCSSKIGLNPPFKQAMIFANYSTKTYLSIKNYYLLSYFKVHQSCFSSTWP